MKADDTMMKAEMHNSVQRQHDAEPLAQKNASRRIAVLIMLIMFIMFIMLN